MERTGAFAVVGTLVRWTFTDYESDALTTVTASPTKVMPQHRTIAHSEMNSSLRTNIDKTKMKTSTDLQQQHQQRFPRTYQPRFSLNGWAEK